MHEASEEEGAAEEEDERIVCEECKSRDEGESKADKPDVEREKSGHAEDADWRVRKLAVSLLCVNFVAEDQAEDEADRFVAEGVDGVPEDRG